MRARVLTVTAVVVALAVTGCGGAGSSNTAARTTAAPTLSSADYSACVSLAADTEAGNNAGVLMEDFAVPGRRMGTISPELKPYAMLVGSEAQLVQSGAGDAGTLDEYVREMRARCVAEGWKPLG